MLFAKKMIFMRKEKKVREKQKSDNLMKNKNSMWRKMIKIFTALRQGIALR